jgi:hypothetical protein
VQREPLDQTSVNAIIGGSGGIFQKMLMREAHRGLGDTMVGPAPLPGGLLGFASGGRLLESSKVKFSSFSCFDPSFWFSGITLLTIQIHQNL